MTHYFICVICELGFQGYGNNAQPLADGRCCDGCDLLVIKERIRLARDR